ncbi:MAG: hypothetical protein HQK99_11410 [Nitrospirae bacterium]|nr:hypothetical protein [Nitrospirota bacterium]
MGSELYLDLVSKTIISMLSKEIAVDVGSQVGARVNELLNNTLAGLISEQISAQSERLGRSIIDLQGALKPQINELGARISEISGQIIENLGEKSGLTGEIEAIKGHLAGSMDTLSKQMTDIGQSTKALAEKSDSDTLKQAMDILAAQAAETAAASDAMKRELSTINETLQKNLIGQIAGISEKIDESIKQSIQSSGKEEGEMLRGIYYSMKKLVTEFNREKEDSILFSKQSLTGMSDLKRHIEDDLGKRLVDTQEQNTMLHDAIQNVNKTLQNNVKDQNKLLLSIIAVIEKQLPFFSGKVDDAISGIDGKIAGFERTTLSKITATGTELMKFIDENVANNLKDTGKSYGPLMDELSAIRQLTNNLVKDQSDVLQGVFLSVKKLLNISAKERDSNEKVAHALANALDNLYSHLRRLESEKDELDVELLRLSGDDYFKNRFKQLEAELHKARSLAEKYQDEKTEMEQKYLKLQQAWEAAQSSDDE